MNDLEKQKEQQEKPEEQKEQKEQQEKPEEQEEKITLSKNELYDIVNTIIEEKLIKFYDDNKKEDKENKIDLVPKNYNF